MSKNAQAFYLEFTHQRQGGILMAENGSRALNVLSVSLLWEKMALFHFETIQ